MRLLRLLIIFLLIGGGFLFLSGCTSLDKGKEPDLPWNEPAGWENGSFAIPM